MQPLLGMPASTLRHNKSLSGALRGLSCALRGLSYAVRGVWALPDLLGLLPPSMSATAHRTTPVVQAYLVRGSHSSAYQLTAGLRVAGGSCSKLAPPLSGGVS